MPCIKRSISLKKQSPGSTGGAEGFGCGGELPGAQRPKSQAAERNMGVRLLNVIQGLCDFFVCGTLASFALWFVGLARWQ